MSKLLTLRQKHHLTQDELAEKSGVSVRTIQRIEAGMEPKGFTVKALAQALKVQPGELIDQPISVEAPIAPLAKLINLSSLPFVLLPPLNIIVPLVLMYHKKAVSDLAKQIISLQILWTIISVITFILSAFLNRIFSADFPFVIVAAALLASIDIYIIIRNTSSIDKKQALSIRLGFNFL